MLPNVRRSDNRWKILLIISLGLIILFFAISAFKNKTQKPKLVESINEKIINLQNVSKNSDLCRAFSENSKYLRDKYCLKSTGRKKCEIADISRKDMLDYQKDLENLINRCAKTKK